MQYRIENRHEMNNRIKSAEMKEKYHYGGEVRYNFSVLLLLFNQTHIRSINNDLKRVIGHTNPRECKPGYTKHFIYPNYAVLNIGQSDNLIWYFFVRNSQFKISVAFILIKYPIIAH